MTQKSRLLAFLTDNPQGLTSLEASRLVPPIMRISERIRELERLGYQFDRIVEKTDAAKFVRYKLKAAPRDFGKLNPREPRITQGDTPLPVVAAPCSAKEYAAVRG